MIVILPTLFGDFSMNLKNLLFVFLPIAALSAQDRAPVKPAMARSAIDSDRAAEEILADGGQTQEVSCCLYPCCYNRYQPFSHRVLDLCSLRSSLSIEDGSVWEIHPAESYKTVSWRIGDPIALIRNFNRFAWSDYYMLNLNTGTNVCVALALGPILNNPHSKFIAAIDCEQGVLALTDASKWVVSSDDLALFRQWAINDCIIVGQNETYFSRYEAVLINSNMNHSVRAKQF